VASRARITAASVLSCVRSTEFSAAEFSANDRGTGGVPPFEETTPTSTSNRITTPDPIRTGMLELWDFFAGVVAFISHWSGTAAR
jgi:hypothetical protein